ncbi:cupin-like domain-containing protein, partial [Klebsiella pneumoniae]|uniref:cupin-like domain-containing protein n=3 Tax=Pseudomonadota TaxID=1224 RepID=UPI0027306FE0
VAGTPEPPALYVGSTTVEAVLPGFLDANGLGLGARDALVSLWLGNRTRIAAHYDLPDNLAIVAAGRRRFTVFPPEQLPN